MQCLQPRYVVIKNSLVVVLSVHFAGFGFSGEAAISVDILLVVSLNYFAQDVHPATRQFASKTTPKDVATSFVLYRPPVQRGGRREDYFSRNLAAAGTRAYHLLSLMYLASGPRL